MGPPVALPFVPAIATAGAVEDVFVVFRFTKQFAVVVPQVAPVGLLACNPLVSLVGPRKNVYRRVGESTN